MDIAAHGSRARRTEREGRERERSIRFLNNVCITNDIHDSGVFASHINNSRIASTTITQPGWLPINPHANSP